jgi:hypothetical protein
MRSEKQAGCLGICSRQLGNDVAVCILINIVYVNIFAALRCRLRLWKIANCKMKIAN